MVSRCDFEYLRRLVDSEPSSVNISLLGLWCENFGEFYWNGECYDVSFPSDPSGTLCLFPVYESSLDGDLFISGYELR